MAVNERDRQDALVLMAVERAGNENDGPDPDARYDYYGPAGTADCEAIARHLGGRRVPSAPWQWEGTVTEGFARRVCRRLEKDGRAYIARPHHGRVHYGVTPDGEEWLRSLEESWEGEMPELPESPAHRDWREARESAERELPALREAVREACAAVLAVVDVDDWREGLAETGWGGRPSGLHNAGSRVEEAVEELAEALHDLTEPEPDG